jgi:lysophospholipase L1-like esterase
MAAFYAAVRQLDEQRVGVVRALHYGDSHIVVDTITGTIRRRLQARFGDGGHGYVAVGKAWRWYKHRDVEHGANDRWTMELVTRPSGGDGLYGVGGISATALDAGATAWFATKPDAPVGGRVSRFDVLYWKEPGGGQLLVTVDGTAVTTLSTRATTEETAVLPVPVPDGPHRLELTTVGEGEVRLFGIVMERQAGLVYNSLGLNSARAATLLALEPGHFREQLRTRRASLVVLSFGTNEATDDLEPPAAYRAGLKKVLAAVREGAPEASCLVTAPPDRARKARRGRRGGTLAGLPGLVRVQQEVALEAGCAFFDTFTAMGGPGTIVQWARQGLAARDLTHLSPAGGEIIGELLAGALLQGYEAYVREAAGRGGALRMR